MLEVFWESMIMSITTQKHRFIGKNKKKKKFILVANMTWPKTVKSFEQGLHTFKF